MCPTSKNMIRTNLLSKRLLILLFLLFVSTFLYSFLVLPFKYNPIMDHYFSEEDYYLQVIDYWKAEMSANSGNNPEKMEYAKEKIRLLQYEMTNLNLFGFLYTYEEVIHHPFVMGYLLFFVFIVFWKENQHTPSSEKEAIFLIRNRFVAALFFAVLFLLVDLMYAVLMAEWVEKIYKFSFSLFQPGPVIISHEIRNIPVVQLLLLSDVDAFISFMVLAAVGLLIRSVSSKKRWKLLMMVGSIPAGSLIIRMSDSVKDFFVMDHGSTYSSGWGIITPFVATALFLYGAWWWEARKMKKREPVS